MDVFGSEKDEDKTADKKEEEKDSETEEKEEKDPKGEKVKEEGGEAVKIGMQATEDDQDKTKFLAKNKLEDNLEVTSSS
jgi:hypothetical protein